MSETATPTPAQIQWALDYVDNHDGTTNSAQKVLAAAYRASAPVSQKVREIIQAIRVHVREIDRVGLQRMDLEIGQNCVQSEALISEALTLLAPDTRTEYDKAVEALAPYLPDGKYLYGGGELWYAVGEKTYRTYIKVPLPDDEDLSYRTIKSGKVVPHV